MKQYSFYIDRKKNSKKKKICFLKRSSSLNDPCTCACIEIIYAFVYPCVCVCVRVCVCVCDCIY